MDISEFIKPSMLLPSISPNKDLIAFYYDESGVFELYIYNLKNKVIKKISSGHVPTNPEYPPCWCTSNNVIYLFNDETSVLYSFDILQLTVQEELSSPYNFFPIDVNDSGTILMLMGYVTNRVNLWTFNLIEKKLRQITNSVLPISNGKFMKGMDGWIIYTASLNNNHGQGILIYSLTEERDYLLYSSEKNSSELFIDFSQDNKSIIFNSSGGEYVFPGILDLESGNVKLFNNLELDLSGVCMSRNFLISVSTNKATSEIVLINIENGELRRPNIPVGVIHWIALTNEEHDLLISMSTVDNPPKLFNYNLIENSIVELVENKNLVIHNNRVNKEHIYYESLDGLKIPAIVNYNSNEVANAPAVLMLHGGPHSQWLMNYNPLVNYLVNLNIIVLQLNVRGSTGYGSSFKHALMKWGSDDVFDVFHGYDYLLKNWKVNKNSIFVLGYSYGAYLAMKTALQYPSLWKGVINWAGFIDLERMYRTSGARILLEKISDTDKLEELSAIKDIKHLETPLLIIHGAKDNHCPIEQAYILKEELEKYNKIFYYEEFRTLGHYFYSEFNGLEIYKKIGEFIKERLNEE
ncbi:S9 family peptidase [Robertmurraya sp. FSL R5-0851]|uniref:S9 family peptidase n=1 Tax=Robertmurraya sp. FSL R5-0851 TaxID=2921584 RepID=UPI0030F6E9BB